jgi:hypothetical protein
MGESIGSREWLCACTVVPQQICNTRYRPQATSPTLQTTRTHASRTHTICTHDHTTTRPHDHTNHTTTRPRPHDHDHTTTRLKQTRLTHTAHMPHKQTQRAHTLTAHGVMPSRVPRNTVPLYPRPSTSSLMASRSPVMMRCTGMAAPATIGTSDGTRTTQECTTGKTCSHEGLS